MVAGDSKDAVGCWWKGTRCEWDAYACADSGDAEGDAAGDASADAETDEVRWWNARDDEGDEKRVLFGTDTAGLRAPKMDVTASEREISWIAELGWLNACCCLAEIVCY